jgi:hypothetical protein
MTAHAALVALAAFGVAGAVLYAARAVLLYGWSQLENDDGWE